MDAGVEPFFPYAGLPKFDLVIFYTFLQNLMDLESLDTMYT
jgi:hypothetical protein